MDCCTYSIVELLFLHYIFYIYVPNFAWFQTAHASCISVAFQRYIKSKDFCVNKLKFFHGKDFIYNYVFMNFLKFPSAHMIHVSISNILFQKILYTKLSANLRLWSESHCMILNTVIIKRLNEQNMCTSKGLSFTGISC